MHARPARGSVSGCVCLLVSCRCHRWHRVHACNKLQSARSLSLSPSYCCRAAPSGSSAVTACPLTHGAKSVCQRKYSIVEDLDARGAMHVALVSIAARERVLVMVAGHDFFSLF
jgi:hypothetical protein